MNKIDGYIDSGILIVKNVKKKRCFKTSNL